MRHRDVRPVSTVTSDFERRHIGGFLLQHHAHLAAANGANPRLAVKVIFEKSLLLVFGPWSEGARCRSLV